MLHSFNEFASVRSFLSSQTHEQHQALHDHALFSKLLSEDLTVEMYLACIEAQHQTFQVIESERDRLGVFEDFSLARQVAAMARDLGREDPTHATLSKGGPPAVLGALYVAHGSQFGRTVIHKALLEHLPTLPHHYFGLPQQPKLWRVFLQAVEATAPEDAQSLLNGANEAFALMHREANAALLRLDLGAQSIAAQ